MPALRIKKLPGMEGLARFELATTGLGKRGAVIGVVCFVGVAGESRHSNSAYSGHFWPSWVQNWAQERVQ
jgi:hypothetical protein